MKWKYLAITGIIVAFAVFVFGKEKEPELPPTTGEHIFIIGDSLVYGRGATEGNDFVSRLSNRLRIPIVNLGIPGNTTGAVLERLDREVLKRNPRVIVILVGGNDFLRRLPKEDTLANIRTIVSQSKETGARVILVGVSRLVYNGEYAAIAKEFDVLFVPHVMDGILQHRELMSDALHPNDEGYKLVADAIEPYLFKALWE